MRQPARAGGRGLGVGLDLPWGAPVGFRRDPERGDIIEDRVVRFLESHAGAFAYMFVSWQPKCRNRLDPSDYVPAFDDLFERSPRAGVRTLHQTMLNLGALEAYDRAPIIDLTNALIERYGLAWVNEDLGLWSIHGRPLPYPLPPYLTRSGLRAAVRNAEAVQARLQAPLVLEFPGFSPDESPTLGELHAYDFFREVVEESGSPATLDLGHLLSYQWLRGKRGEALYEELERLPTDHCLEIHMSGCEISAGRFMDVHHGILLDEQFELLSRLLPYCPNLRAVSYEDPKFDARGELLAGTRSSFERLRAQVAAWGGVITLDQALDRLIHKRSYREAYLQGQFAALELGADDLAVLGSMDGEALRRLAERVAREVLTRKHAGSGSLLELYPRSIQAWREAHSEAASGLGLAFAFLDSPAFDAYRELPFAGIGTSLEEAFFRFCELEGLADRVTLEHEFLAAMMQLLLVSPRAPITLPDCIQRTAHGFFSVSARGVPTLYAAVRGRLVSGPLTPFLADLLRAEAPPRCVAERHQVSWAVLEQSLARLSELGLVP